MADGIDVDDAEAPPPRRRFLARPNPRNSPALILCAGIVFSFGPLIFRLTTGTTGAWQYLVYRFAGLVASGTLWLCVTLPAGWKLRLTRRRVARSALGGCLMMGCNICFIVALERIDSATTLLLQTLAPFSAALLGWLVRRERTDFVTWCSMVLAVVGTAIMGSEWDASDPIGLCAAMGIAVLLGGYAVVLRGTDEAAPEPRVQFLLNGVFGLATALLIVCASQGAAALRVPARDAICGLSAGGLCLGLGIPLYQAAGRHVAPARTTLLLLSEVILAPLWTFAFASEVPTGRTIGGGSVLLLAIVWLTLHPGPPDAGAQKPTAEGRGGSGRRGGARAAAARARANVESWLQGTHSRRPAAAQLHAHDVQVQVGPASWSKPAQNLNPGQPAAAPGRPAPPLAADLVLANVA